MLSDELLPILRVRKQRVARVRVPLPEALLDGDEAVRELSGGEMRYPRQLQIPVRLRRLTAVRVHSQVRRQDRRLLHRRVPARM